MHDGGRDDAADLRLTAFHEAGHAVAAVVRGRELRTLTIEATTEHRGFTGYRGRPFDDGFIAWAGPWAQARADWPGDGIVLPDSENPVPYWERDDDHQDVDTFDTALLVAMLTGGQDDAEAVEAWRERSGLAGVWTPELERSTEQVWSRELSHLWPVIQQVAGALLAGELVEHGDVLRAVEDLQPG